MATNQLNLLAFNRPEIRTLHLTWVAFFISFMVWFAHAPLMVIIREAMHLTEQEVKILLILNVALTIPARIVVGMLVDKYGPKQLFSSAASHGERTRGLVVRSRRRSVVLSELER
jgi:NNP family nitrate/nitrite transporter-like MFS transporter